MPAEQMAQGMFNHGLGLAQIGAVGRSAAVLEDLIDRFGDTTDPEILEVVVLARQLQDEISAP